MDYLKKVDRFFKNRPCKDAAILAVKEEPVVKEELEVKEECFAWADQTQNDIQPPTPTLKPRPGADLHGPLADAQVAERVGHGTNRSGQRFHNVVEYTSGRCAVDRGMQYKTIRIWTFFLTQTHFFYDFSIELTSRTHFAKCC